MVIFLQGLEKPTESPSHDNRSERPIFEMKTSTQQLPFVNKFPITIRKKFNIYVQNCPEIDFLRQVNQRLAHFHKIHLNIILFMLRSPKCSLPVPFQRSISQSPLHATCHIHLFFPDFASLRYHCGYKLCTSSSSTLLYHPDSLS